MKIARSEVRLLSCLALHALGTTLAAAGPASFVQDGKAGFVVARFEYALSHDAEKTGACPNGMTTGISIEGFGNGGPASGGQRTEGNAEEEGARRLMAALSGPNGRNACAYPEDFGPDSRFRTVTGPNVPVYGIDLDGKTSSAKGKPAPGTCAHGDFAGMNGERGIDNQFFRVVGCSKSFQSTGLSNGFEIEMHTGAWGILITLSGVDDIRNDDSVEVGFYANGDPIELSPTREPLANATYAILQDPRFHAKARGRIVDGVLTTEPVDVRFYKITNSIYLERPLVDARVKMTLSEDGRLEGVLAGYTPVEAMYDLQYAFRNGTNGKGEPADLRLKTISSMGQAAVLGHTCNGAYYALHEHADGHPDPKTGKCTSISTQYRVKAIPAFVVDAQTKSGQSAWSSEEPEADGGPPVTRRLTESQYRATVADIFAPDIPVVGRFERELRSDGLIAIGTSEAGMSAFSVEQYDASARGIAAAVVSKERRDKLVPCQPKAETSFDKTCATTFVEHYGPLLFRRPLTSQETKRFVATVRLGQERLGSFYSGLEFALAGMMVRPDFLLRIERVEPDRKQPGKLRLDHYSKATRLSYFLTNSTPDRELLRAAGAGELDSQEGLARQIDRLMASPRFEGAVRAFFEDMLLFELFEDLSKDPVIYPAYSSVVAADAQEQTLRTITNHLIAKNGDYRDLFTTTDTVLTRALGRVYRVPVAARNDWERKEFSAASGHSGILTNVSFLALHSHPGRSSPTLRGKAIREIFMCQKVPDPPPDVDFSAVDLDSTNKALPTARHRLDGHRTQPVCAGCHLLMDPLGLTLENFDGAGSFRTHENEALIDVSGSLDGTEFSSAKGLGQALHDHPQTSYCLVDKMYRSAVGRSTVDAELIYINNLSKAFAANGYRVPALMRAIAASRTFYAVSAQGGEQRVTTERADTQQRTGDKS